MDSWKFVYTPDSIAGVGGPSPRPVLVVYAATPKLCILSFGTHLAAAPV